MVLALAGSTWADGPPPRRPFPDPSPIGPWTPAAGRPAVPTHPAWSTERAVAPRWFWAMEDRSLALDDSGYPHIAYGADFLYYAWRDDTQWHTEVVDDAGGVGSFANLALDAAGRPHISYYDSSNDNLKYAFSDGTTWHVEVVDSAGDVGGWCAIALDTAGRPRIAYLDATNADLKYAAFDGSAWHFQVVESAGQVGWHASLVLDAQDRPHVTYYLAISGSYGNDLHYAYLSGTVWLTTTVDTGGLDGAVGWYNSLALDSQGRPHVSYFDFNQGRLKYARYDGTSWQIAVVDFYDAPGWHGTSLALDAQDRPHISYCPYGGWYNCGELRYATYDGATWNSTVVDASADVGEYSSLALDNAGHPHISYYDDTHMRLKYTRYDGSAWQVEPVDQGGDVGQYTALEIDAAGRPHMSYYVVTPYQDLVNGNLAYAHFAGPAWQTATVDASTDVEGSNSLALGAAGRPRLSYSTYVPAWGLHYAAFDGHTWQHALVDGGPVGDSNALALDAAGQPHIAYIGHEAVPSLRYAYFDGAAWVTQTVTSSVFLSWPVALALDAAGYPHIVYYLDGLYDVMYAYYDGAAWHSEAVERTWSGSGYVALALDAAGRPHVGYYDNGSARAVKYAFRDEQGWHVTVVDSGIGVVNFGVWTSLALDAQGLPHLSYLDGMGYDLKYAHYDGRDWHIEVVDSAGDVGRFLSLALDPQGRPCISYYDTTNRDLKYACRRGAPYSVHLALVYKGP
jgi:hypothetical protein